MSATLFNRLVGRLIREPSTVHEDPSTVLQNLSLRLLILRPKAKAFLALFALFGALLGLSVPVAQKYLLDALTHDRSLALTLTFAAFGLMLASRLLMQWVRIYGLREGTITVSWLANRLYEHAINLENAYRHRKTQGETTALFTTHVQHISFFFEEIFPLFFTAIIPLLAAPIALQIFFSVPIGPTVIMLVVLITVCGGLALRQAGLFRSDKILDEYRLSRVNEWLQNISSLRTLNWTPHWEDAITERRQLSTWQRLRVVTNGSFMNSISVSAPPLLNLAAIVTAVKLSTEPLTPGLIFGITWILGVFLAMPLRILPWVIVIWQDAQTSLSRLQDFFLYPRESHETSAEPLEGFKSVSPEIQIRGLQVKIGDHQLITDVDLTIRPGAFIGIVGEVGSGKSLLLRALIGDVDADFNVFKLGDRALKPHAKSWRRSMFAFVPQEAFTMGATLHENVRFVYGDLDEDEHERIMESLNFAQFLPDLETLEGGLATEIGERGINLSGGQKQRLAIARAHYADRPILLLDDCLSALDVETEQLLVAQLLQKPLCYRTRILATHRHDILPHTDRIVWMKDGKIYREGSFQDLMQDAEFSSFIMAHAQHTETEEES